VRCAKDINHEEIAKPAKLSPYDIPGFNLFNLKGRQKEMVEELGKEKATKLMKYEGVVSLTRAAAMKILQTIWPEAPEVEVIKAAMVCHQYGLNPLMKHVFLIPFKRRQKGMVVGEDYVTVLGIKANRLIAHRCDDFSYLDNTPRVMTEEEQKSIFGEVDNDKIWAITRLKDSKGNEAQGYGSWPRGEDPYGVEKGNTRANMAFIRSERNALDRLFAGEMPQGVEVIDEEYVEAEYSIIKPEGGGKIGAQAEKGAGEGKPELPKNPVFQNWGELAQAAANLGVTIEDVFKRAGVKKWQDFASYRDAWNIVEELVTERAQQPKMI